jgi:hypothetical protein
MKYFFTIARYNDYRQKIFDEVISPRNQAYCDKHGYKYVVIGNEHDIIPFRGNITWNKISVIRDLLNAGKLQDGDIITNFDADCLILDDSTEFAPDKDYSMALAIDSGNTYCFGWTSFKINEWSRTFINRLLSDDLWHKRIQIATPHEGFPDRPPYPFALEFREQAMFYALFGIKRHSNDPFITMRHRGIGSASDDDTAYGVVEFAKNVKLYGPEFNCTIWPGESDTTFYINKLLHPEEVKIRHLTGCDWNVYKNWI